MEQLKLPDALIALGVQMRPMRNEDHAAQYELHLSGRWEELAGVTDWSEEQKRAFLLQQGQMQLSHYLAYYGDAMFGILEKDDQLVGRLFLHFSRGEIRVVDIVLMPTWRNRGVGGALLVAVQELAAQTGRKVSIHVEKFNPARRLYQRLGFVKAEDKEVYDLLEWYPQSKVAL